MSKTWWILLFSALFLGLGSALFFIVFVRVPQHRITFENIRLIKKGMTREDVEAVFGVPSGDYSCGAQFCYVFSTREIEPETQVEWWLGEESGVEVLFDERGKVDEIRRGIANRPGVESFFGIIRRWLGV